MLFIEILRNIDMYKEEKYATYHLILKKLTTINFFFSRNFYIPQYYLLFLKKYI